ncbi:coniferyl-aldehyde dehydrogenase [Pseudomonas sp. JAI111]|uniref:coniferyl aldehyde dehydrogenase n=1 Tax=Pseudomonas sp. JAI111 TaxID=2735913 RepID=UPI002168689B|nr:coniferyl aldehyde dehydrogenase [Pseudomonas sp. JAI111]MCS3835755.1 coniferyl-aldehyde dehydrogenase [Pseudomonas sp. JAI111]
MNAHNPEFNQLHMPAEFQQCFDNQRAAHLKYAGPTHAERMADLDALARLLKENRHRLVEAINLDYGNRSEFETLFAEFFVVLETIKDTKKNLKIWMKPQRRHIDVMMYPGASNRVIPQPLGVVGVIVPWNFPLNLSFCPLAAILAAGNRAMIKMSENSRHLATLLIEISPQYFPEEKLRFFDDGGGRGPAFSSLPFDHLLFTGSGATGRAVMANAARNLTPVTLELGGKAPAVVGPDFSIKTAAERIMWVKMFNAGQICTNVDYVFLPEGATEEFAAHCKRLFAERFPDINGNDYTSIIDERAYVRLTATLEDARTKGARLVNLAEGQTPNVALRKFAPHLVFDPTPQMQLSQREIFGPILPVRTYRNAQEVADYINAHDRPLAIYPFTNDKALQNFYISRVMSGGVGVNEALLHVAQHDLPFGGVGPSGMGHYHSREGFNTFSKLRPVFYQGRFSAIQALFQPPYAGRAIKLMNLLIRFKG